jgi:CRP/FNR family transcriptional regulator
MARKCITLSQRIETLSLRTVRQRLAQYLLSHCGGEKTCLVRLESNKTELAKILGTIPETLSRTLKQFQEEGTIRVEDKDIAVLDCMKLKSELFS